MHIIILNMCMYVFVFIYAALKGCFADAHSFRFIRAEEAGVVALLHDYVGDARLVVLLQLDAGVSDGQQLVVQDLHKDDTCMMLQKTSISNKCCPFQLYIHQRFKVSTRIWSSTTVFNIDDNQKNL